MFMNTGTTFAATETVDKYRALYYAGASGDFNPIHIDPDFGKFVGLNGAILQGLCTLAFVAKTVTDQLGDPGRLKKIRCRFSAPVMIEDVITIEGVVSDVKDNLGAIDLKVTRQTGDEVLQKVRAEVAL